MITMDPAMMRNFTSVLTIQEVILRIIMAILIGGIIGYEEDTATVLQVFVRIF